MTTRSLETNEAKSYICWSAIFAGMIMALILAFLLDLLGLGLGFTVFTANAQTISNIGSGSVIWLILTGIAAAFIGGWVASRFSGVTLAIEGLLHGLLAWGLSTFLTVMVMTSTIGMIVGGVFNTLGQGISVVGQATATLGKSAATNAPQIFDAAQNILPKLGLPFEKVKQQAERMLDKTKEMDIQNLSTQDTEQLIDAITQWYTAKSDNDIESAKQKVTDFLVEKAAMSQQDAESTVKDWQEKYDQLMERAQQKSEEMKQKAISIIEPVSHISGAVIVTIFFIFLIGAAAGAAGGILGVSRERKYSRKTMA